MDAWMPLAADGSFLGARGGRYKPVSLLGRGSFGTCVLVKVPPDCTNGNGPLRVVKTVDLLRASDEDTASRRSEALREAEVLKSLRHPNIIGYDDAFLADNHLCIVMEYADGGDLSVAIARRREGGAMRRYHEREAMAIFAQLSLALRHVHALRILHRDVKSQNVFLTNSGVVKLGDFGVAKVLAASEVCAATRIGTPQTVAPELCENHPYDFKVDVWGLGVILYQLLALECPFNGASFAALAVKICTREPQPVPSVYSPETRQLVSRLLSKRAEDRPSSAEIIEMAHVRRSIAGLQGQSPGRPGVSLSLARGGAAETSPRCFASGADSPGGASPLRMLRRSAAKALRRCATVPECASPEVARARKGAAVSKKSATSPQKAKGGSPKKLFRRLSGSPHKAPRVLQAPHSLLPEADGCAADAFTSPGSKGSVSDLLAYFLTSPVAGSGPYIDEPAKSSRSDGADSTSTMAGTHDGDSGRSRSMEGGSDHGGQAVANGLQSIGQAAEELATCTAMLSALEKEFGLV